VTTNEQQVSRTRRGRDRMAGWPSAHLAASCCIPPAARAACSCRARIWRSATAATDQPTAWPPAHGKVLDEDRWISGCKPWLECDSVFL